MGKFLAAAATTLIVLSGPALAAPVCPPGLSLTTFPSCEIGVAVFRGVDGTNGCFFVTVNGNTYAVIPPSTPADEPGFQSLKDGLNMGKGQMHSFLSSGQLVTPVCALPNVAVKPLGDIQ